MKNSVIRQSLVLLMLLAASASMAASVTIIPGTLPNNVGDTYTLTVRADVVNTYGATMALSFDADVVSFVSGTMPASGPFSTPNGGSFIKNSPSTQNPTVFNIFTYPATLAGLPYDAVILTFEALALGEPNIVISDDGGNATGWFDADTFEYIPVTYAFVPGPPAIWLLGTGCLALVGRLRRKAA